MPLERLPDDTIDETQRAEDARIAKARAKATSPTRKAGTWTETEERATSKGVEVQEKTYRDDELIRSRSYIKGKGRITPTKPSKPVVVPRGASPSEVASSSLQQSLEKIEGDLTGKETSAELQSKVNRAVRKAVEDTGGRFTPGKEMTVLRRNMGRQFVGRWTAQAAIAGLGGLAAALRSGLSVKRAEAAGYEPDDIQGVRKFVETTVVVGPDKEAVSKEDFAKLTEEDQRLLERQGTVEFRRLAKIRAQEFAEATVVVGPDKEAVSKEDFAKLSKEDQRLLRRHGTVEFNRLANIRSQEFAEAGVSGTGLPTSSAEQKRLANVIEYLSKFETVEDALVAGVNPETLHDVGVLDPDIARSRAFVDGLTQKERGISKDKGFEAVIKERERLNNVIEYLSKFETVEDALKAGVGTETLLSVDISPLDIKRAEANLKQADVTLPRAKELPGFLEPTQRVSGLKVDSPFFTQQIQAIYAREGPPVLGYLLKPAQTQKAFYKMRELEDFQAKVSILATKIDSLAEEIGPKEHALGVVRMGPAAEKARVEAELRSLVMVQALKDARKQVNVGPLGMTLKEFDDKVDSLQKEIRRRQDDLTKVFEAVPQFGPTRAFQAKETELKALHSEMADLLKAERRWESQTPEERYSDFLMKSGLHYSQSDADAAIIAMLYLVPVGAAIRAISTALKPATRLAIGRINPMSRQLGDKLRPLLESEEGFLAIQGLQVAKEVAPKTKLKEIPITREGWDAIQKALKERKSALTKQEIEALLRKASRVRGRPETPGSSKPTTPDIDPKYLTRPWVEMMAQLTTKAAQRRLLARIPILQRAPVIDAARRNAIEAALVRQGRIQEVLLRKALPARVTPLRLPSIRLATGAVIAPVALPTVLPTAMPATTTPPKTKTVVEITSVPRLKVAPSTGLRAVAVPASVTPLAMPKVKPISLTKTTVTARPQPKAEPVAKLTPVPVPKPTPKPTPKPKPTPTPPPTKTAAPTGRLTRPRLPTKLPGGPGVLPPPFLLPGGKSLPPGQYPREVEWNQGQVTVTLDLDTGQRKFRERTGGSLKPGKSFKVVRIDTTPPKSKQFDMGVVTVHANEKGLRFSHRRVLSKRTRNPFKKRGL